MLGNSIDNMLLISPSTSTQSFTRNLNPIDEKNSSLMEKSQSQQALKCPRCDSTNTKFCYYNNYSLSQPRHFCKACKRYWTRGGTLRNVPVGGGCRKNKRVKRASTSSATAGVDGGGISVSNMNPNGANLNPQSQIDAPISGSDPTQMNPLLYGLQSGSSELNIPLFNSISGYDLSGFSLGFASGKQIQDSVLGSSLLVHQQKKFKDNSFQQTAAALTPFEESNLNTESAQLQAQQSRFDWSNINNNNQNPMDQIGFSSLDPPLYWNPNSTTSAIWQI